MKITSPNLERALKDLTLLHPFWACLALHYEFKESPTIPTFAVDGKTIFYNRKFCDSISVDVNMFAIAHECGHPMFDHVTRPLQPRPGDGKVYGYTPKGKPIYWEPKLYNVAGDAFINAILKLSGFSLWNKCILYDWVDVNTMNTEQIYSKLEQKHPPRPSQPSNQPSNKKDKGNDSGNNNSNPDGDSGSSSEDEDPSQAGNCWQPAADCPEPDKICGSDIKEPAEGFSPHEMKGILVRAAAVAKAQGKLPATLEGLIKAATEPQYPVYMLLERFIDMNLQSDDSSWKKPHRDFFSQGIILPSEFSDKVSHVVLCYDTSGSVPDADLSRFHRIATDIVKRLKPVKLTLVQCDAAVSSAIDYTKPSEWPTSIKCTGRGGTDFRPPFELVKSKRWKPSCFVYLTDLMGSFPQYAPNYPVLWVSTKKDSKAPFGQTIYLNQ